jgi:hypothetical protein
MIFKPLCLKKKKGKRSGGLSQVVEHLPGKCKVVNSNSCTAYTGIIPREKIPLGNEQTPKQ